MFALGLRLLQFITIYESDLLIKFLIFVCKHDTRSVQRIKRKLLLKNKVRYQNI